MRSSRALSREVWLLIAVLAVLVTIGAWSSLRSRDAGPELSTYDASPAGFRAWYELLEREGIAVSRFENRPAFLDRSIDTLILADIVPLDFADAHFSESDAAALADWVRAGGRLVMVGNGPLAAILRPALASAKPHARLRPGPIEHRSLGRGQVVLVSDASPFQNESIAAGDNARLAYGLGRPRMPHGAVAFDEAVRGHLVPAHWWNALPPRLVAAILLTFAVLAVALAGAAIRLGPPLVAGDRREATSVEYVDALASLLERGRGASRAIAEALASTRRLLAHDGARASQASLVSFAELEAAAAIALPTDATLVRALSIAHVIRKEVERGTR